MRSGFAHGRVDPHHAGQAGGHAESTGSAGSGQVSNISGKYKPVEHGGLKADGSKDKRVDTRGTLLTICIDSISGSHACNIEFAHGKVDPHQAGHQGGSR
jgi:hypothetical protein